MSLFVILPLLSGIVLDDSKPQSSNAILRAEIAFEEAREGRPNDRPWWVLFDDAELTAAIGVGLDNNYDVKAAAARILQAEASSLRALQPLLPSITADANISLSPADARFFNFGGAFPGGGDIPSVFYSGTALINARWQLDIWGRSYLAYRAAELNAKANAGERDSVALALTDQIANAYFDVVLAKQAIGLVVEQIEANRRLLELLELRFERGDSTGLDVLQQKQQYAARAAELPPLRSQRRTAEQRLAILMGRPPSREPPATRAELPTLPLAPALGKPNDLLLNRPDLRAAVDRYEAADRQAAGALRVHLPTLSIDGNAGYQYNNNDTTFQSDSLWGAGAAVSLPLFSGFGDVGQVREARANESALLATLNQRYLQAISEVEGAVVTEREALEQLRLIQEQATAAEAALSESEARYVNGLTDYLSVLTALNAAQSAQRSVLQTRRSAITARLRLYQSLGGPWSKSLRGGTGESQ